MVAPFMSAAVKIGHISAGESEKTTFPHPADTDSVRWDRIALFEELAADCFNRPLLIALCERFQKIAKAEGDESLAAYAGAKLALQYAVISRKPTLDATRKYIDLKQHALEIADPLLESIATAKLAAAVSQAYVGAGNVLFSCEDRRQLEQFLDCSLPGPTELSHCKVRLFAEALCLAVRGRRGCLSEAVAFLASLQDTRTCRAVRGEIAAGPMRPRVRAIVGAAVGIANEYRDSLDTGYAFFEGILRIHPTFLAAQLAAFYNRSARLEQQVERSQHLLAEMKRHLSICVDSVPAVTPGAFIFTPHDHSRVQSMPTDELLEYFCTRKSAPIREYAEHAVKQIEFFEAGRMDARSLIASCASFAFPEVRSQSVPYSFLCAVENAWRAKLLS